MPWGDPSMESSLRDDSTEWSYKRVGEELVEDNQVVGVITSVLNGCCDFQRQCRVTVQYQVLNNYPILCPILRTMPTCIFEKIRFHKVPCWNLNLI